MARGASSSAFQSCPSDPILSGRYIANSRYVSIEAYPFALPCGEWIEGERIDACSKMNVRWSIVDINSSSHAGEQIDASVVDIKT